MISETRILMGMPVSVSLPNVHLSLVDTVFDWFSDVDRRFSTFHADSEITRLNNGHIDTDEMSSQMTDVLRIAKQTERESDGYFCARDPSGRLDPTGIVKGWAIKLAAELLNTAGVGDYLIDAGGDIQARGLNSDGEPWRVGIRSPFRSSEIVKVVAPGHAGIATSGTYVRGQHIWNPRAPTERLNDVVSITVIGRDILEADRFATAAFAMGRQGIYFIESLPNLEAYQIDALGIATQTSSFGSYVIA